jgi:hypothetical protein
MAYFLYVRIKKVSIVPDKDYLGIVLHEKVVRGLAPEVDMSLRNSGRMEKLARIALAGNIAQKMHAPRSRSGASSDHQTVADIALRLNGSSEAANAWIEWLHISVKDALKVRWAFVDVLAHELVKHKELTREQIVELFLKVRPNVL